MGCGKQASAVPELVDEEDQTDGKAGAAKGVDSRSEAEKIYQAAVAGKPNPIGSMREAARCLTDIWPRTA